jgi:toxin ParE1/3/4
VIVTLTAEAESDLEAIAEYIARDNVTAALNFVHELRKKCRALAQSPLGYPLVPRYQHRNIRRRPVGNYLIFYRIRAEAVEVVHILHGARDYERLLFPEE